MNVRYSRRSLAQIAEILELFAEHSPALASRFSERVEMLAELLARHPTIGGRTDLVNVRVFAMKPIHTSCFIGLIPKTAA